jgi:hypothetical protein
LKKQKALSREELYKRGKGFSLNPKGNPIFNNGPVPTIEDVLFLLRQKWPDYSA